MIYSVLWADKASKQLHKLPNSIAIRIVNKVESIKEDPHHFLEQCEGYPYFHQRVGDYRIILDLNEPEGIIEVLKVGPRKKVYDR